MQASTVSVIGQWVAPRGLVGPLYDPLKTVFGIAVAVMLVVFIAYLLRPRIKSFRNRSGRDSDLK